MTAISTNAGTAVNGSWSGGNDTTTGVNCTAQVTVRLRGTASAVNADINTLSGTTLTSAGITHKRRPNFANSATDLGSTGYIRWELIDTKAHILADIATIKAVTVACTEAELFVS